MELQQMTEQILERLFATQEKIKADKDMHMIEMMAEKRSGQEEMKANQAKAERKADKEETKANRKEDQE
jgi:hypothetical protein